MFGYIKPLVPELKVKENELYKSFYCGLCKSMGLHICKSAALTLSYDIVFLAIVRTMAEDDKTTFKKARCLAHPFKKRTIAVNKEVIPYSAKVSAMLSYYKTLDDLNDEKGFKKLSKRILHTATKRFYKKARITDLDEYIYTPLKELSDLENANTKIPDECAECFGRLLGNIFSYKIDDKDDKKVLYQFGFNIGKWIYFIDAIDDYDKDIKCNRFNPLPEFSPEIIKDLTDTLNMNLIEAENALILLKNKSEELFTIVQNIIYLGMPNEASKVLNKDKEKDINEQSI